MPDSLRYWFLHYTLASAGLAMSWALFRRSGLRHSWLLRPVSALWLAFPFLGSDDFVPDRIAVLSQLTMLSLLVLLFASLVWLAMAQAGRRHDPARRAWLRTAAPLVGLAPPTMAAAAVLQARGNPRLVEVEIPIAGLPKDLHGFRIVQLSDIHFGPFFGRQDLERAVAMANELRAHLAVVTGDLITYSSDDLEQPLALLKRLRADAGIWGCLGNHERHCEEEAPGLAARYGIRILRQEAESLRFGQGILHLAGVDYIPFGRPLPPAARQLRREDAVNVLLAHNPDSFPSARAAGFDLTLAGHTHGGQLNLELARANLNVARIYTPYVKGLYEEAGRAVYVSSGLGTVAAPVRLGAPPEVSLIRLCGA
jgi:predicted MPP superfamily phosphohydrolase